jgi:N6-L-threonylcarbamoyladenine synthase
LHQKIVILAIESSCDDTGAAVIENGRVISNCVATQSVHEQYGGVVPEVASRQHQQSIIPVVDQAIRDSGKNLQDISAVAITKGPGLLGSLLVGVSFAKSLAMSLHIPLIEVHHMQAHVLAHFATENHPGFPFLCLTVSGGHTQIILVKNFLEMEILGETIDDAAGEAFDKAGKLLGLPYPAGPHIDKLAQTGIASYSFPIPNVPDLDFSFSGFKTSVLYFLQKQVQDDPNFIQKNLANICASVQKTIIDILVRKMESAIQKHQVYDIAIAGGVSANSGLRKAMYELGKKQKKNVFIPPFEFCTDNAAMIGITGYYKYLQNDFASLDMSPDPRLSM